MNCYLFLHYGVWNMEALAQSSYYHITTREQLVQAVAFLKAYQQTPDAVMAVDVETYFETEAARETAKTLQAPKKNPIPLPIWDGKQWLGQMRLITIGTHTYLAPYEFRAKQFLFDVMALGPDLVQAALKDLLEAPVLSIGHNYSYDTNFLRARLGIKIKPEYGKCTMIFNKCLRAGDHHYGDKLYECYFQHIPEELFITITGMNFAQYKLFKETQQQSNWGVPILDADQLKYAAEDAFLIFFVYEKQKYLLQNHVNVHEMGFPPTKSLANIYWLESQLVPRYGMMEVRGAPFNAERHEKQVIPFLEAKREGYKAYLTSMPEFQIPQPENCDKIIFKPDYTKATNPSVEAKELAKNVRSYLHKFFKTVQYNAAGLSEVERNKIYADFLAQTPKSYKKDPKDLATRKLAEYEKDLTSPFMVWTNPATDGDEVHVFWRLNTNPVVDHYQLRQHLEQFLPTDYHLLDYEPVNLNSPDQLQRALFKRFGEPVDNTEAETLKQFMSVDPDAVKAILNYKNAKDVAGKYGRGLVSKTTERGFIHSNFHLLGTDTGRTSSSGPNMQNIPARFEMFEEKVPAKLLFRASFEAPPGYVIVGADLSQIEPRLTAEETGDERYIAALVNKEDLHGLTAMACLGLPEPPKKGTFERDFIGKTMNLAISYGIGPNALAEFMFKHTDGAVDWTPQEARAMIDRYFGLYPKIRAKMDEVRRFIAIEPSRYGSLAPFKGHKVFATVTARCGRIRHFTLTPSEEGMQDHVLSADYNPHNRRYYWNPFKARITDVGLQAYNFLIQGTAATCFKLGVLYLEQQLEQMDLDPFTEGLIWVVHDEVGVLVREKYADQVAEITSNALKAACEYYIKRVPSAVDVHIGKTWMDVH